MAIGDTAAAAGLAVFAATQDKRLGYQNDNQRGDELGAHIMTGGHPVANITGLAAALAAKADDSDITTVNAALAGKASTASVSSAAAAAATAQTDANKARTGDWGIDIWVRDVGGMTRQAVWMGNNGLVLAGYASSVRARKQNIRPAADASRAAIAEDWELTPAMARGVTVSLFRYRWAVAAERSGKLDEAGRPIRAHIEIGAIADDLHELGLWPFVVYDEDGKPKGIHYELLGLLALQLAQWTADDLDEANRARAQLEARVDELAAAVAKMQEVDRG